MDVLAQDIGIGPRSERILSAKTEVALGEGEDPAGSALDINDQDAVRSLRTETTAIGDLYEGRAGRGAADQKAISLRIVSAEHRVDPEGPTAALVAADHREGPEATGRDDPAGLVEQRADLSAPGQKAPIKHLDRAAELAAHGQGSFTNLGTAAERRAVAAERGHA